MTGLRRGLRVLRNVALTGGAVAGVLVAVLVLAGGLLGVRPVVVTSGSMEPSIPTGAVVLTRSVPATDVRVGDVVTVRAASGSRVTHRVTDVVSSGDGSAVLRLKGDANDAPDAAPYQADSAGRVVAVVPLVGKVLIGVRTPGGLLALGALGVLLVGVALGRGESHRGSHRGGRRKAPRRRGRRATTTVAAAALAVAVPSAAEAAPWTDDVAVTGTSLTAAVIPTTTLSCGALGVLSVTFSWTAVAGATSYTLFWNGGASSRNVTAPATSTTLTSAISSSTAWVVVNRNFGSVTWTSAASNTRSFTVAVVSLCS